MTPFTLAPPPAIVQGLLLQPTRPFLLLTFAIFVFILSSPPSSPQCLPVLASSTLSRVCSPFFAVHPIQSTMFQTSSVTARITTQLGIRMTPSTLTPTPYPQPSPPNNTATKPSIVTTNSPEIVVNTASLSSNIAITLSPQSIRKKSKRLCKRSARPRTRCQPTRALSSTSCSTRWESTLRSYLRYTTAVLNISPLE